MLIPLERRHARVEERVLVESELSPDPPTVLEDLRPVRVLLGGYVPGLLEERHVDEGRRVALRPRVAVPVPRAAEVAALLDDSDVLDTSLLQPRAGHETGEPAADDRDRHVVGFRLSGDDRHVGVLQVVIEVALDLEVLVVAVGAKTLGALGGVSLLQRLFVEFDHVCLRIRVSGTLAGSCT